MEASHLSAEKEDTDSQNSQEALQKPLQVGKYIHDYGPDLQIVQTIFPIQRD